MNADWLLDGGSQMDVVSSYRGLVMTLKKKRKIFIEKYLNIQRCININLNK